MLLSRLKHYLAGFGDPGHKSRMGAPRRLERLPGADEADAALDRALDLWRVEPPPAHLAGDILRRTLALPQAMAPDTGTGLDLDIQLFPPFWPGLAPFALALLLGCLLGWYGASGTRGPLAEDWLEWVALAAVQEDFADQ